MAGGVAAKVFCKDCVFLTRNMECRAFKYFDLVSGRQKLYPAHTARYHHNMCTVEGKRYVAAMEISTVIDGQVVVCSPAGCEVRDIKDVGPVDVITVDDDAYNGEFGCETFVGGVPRFGVSVFTNDVY